jgi:DNA-binding Xre family transcriptional regulator
MSLEKYRRLAREAEETVDYWSEVASSDFVRELQRLMAQRGVSNAELARRIGTERQYVTKLMGGANVTLQTMVKLAMALGCMVRVHLADRDTVTHWYDEAPGQETPHEKNREAGGGES